MALASTALVLFVAPVGVGEMWRLLGRADAHGWQALLIFALAAPLVLVVAWCLLARTLWPWTVALTVWLGTLAIVAGRLHHWMNGSLWAGLVGVAAVSLACLAFVWSRVPPTHSGGR